VQVGHDVMVTLCRPKLVSGRLVVPVDGCIAPLVQLLNDHGVRTTGCCCGHGKGPGFISFEDAEGFSREIPLETRGALMEGCRHDDPMVSEDFTEEDSRAWERGSSDAVESETGGDDAQDQEGAR